MVFLLEDSDFVLPRLFAKETAEPFEQCSGQGSFGKVYYCKWNGGEAAARVMTWHGSKLKRVDPHQEAELCKRLIHPNLVQTYTFSSREHGGLSQLVIVQEAQATQLTLC